MNARDVLKVENLLSQEEVLNVVNGCFKQFLIKGISYALTRTEPTAEDVHNMIGPILNMFDKALHASPEKLAASDSAYCKSCTNPTESCICDLL